MRSHYSDENAISFRAPDVYLSGLLSVAFAWAAAKKEGDLDTFPEQEATWYLVGIPAGSARITCASGCILLEQGWALAVSAASPMDILFHGEGQLLVLCLKGSIAGSVLRESEAIGGALYPRGAGVLEETFGILRREMEVQGRVAASFGSGAAYRALMALYGTGSKALNNEKQLPQVVEAALKIMQQDFAFLDGIGDLAQRLQVSQAMWLTWWKPEPM